MQAPLDFCAVAGHLVTSTDVVTDYNPSPQPLLPSVKEKLWGCQIVQKALSRSSV